MSHLRLAMLRQYNLSSNISPSSGGLGVGIGVRTAPVLAMVSSVDIILWFSTLSGAYRRRASPKPITHQLPVNVEGTLMYDRLVEFREHFRASCPAHLAPATRVGGERADRFGQRSRAAWCDQEPVHAGLHDLAASGHVGRDDRDAGRGRFDEPPWNTFPAVRRQDRHVDLPQERRHVADMAEIAYGAVRLPLLNLRHGD